MRNGKVKLKYPKLTLLILAFILTYFLFSLGFLDPILSALVSLGLFGAFIVGFFYAYSFTAGTATLMLITLAKSENILFAGLMAGLGALIGDIIIFLFVRHSFVDEINKLAAEKPFQILRKNTPHIVQKYVLPVLSSLIIASPLPTEIGVALLASMKKVSAKKFTLIAYLLHTTGILIILTIGARASIR